MRTRAPPSRLRAEGSKFLLFFSQLLSFWPIFTLFLPKRPVNQISKLRPHSWPKFGRIFQGFLKPPPHLPDKNTHRQKSLPDAFGGCERCEWWVGVSGVSGGWVWAVWVMDVCEQCVGVRTLVHCSSHTVMKYELLEWTKWKWRLQKTYKNDGPKHFENSEECMTTVLSRKL